MRSEELPLEKYDSDKINTHHLERYDQVLEPWVEKEIVLLELGVHKGGSLLLWRDYFPLGKIVGIDIDLPKEFKPTERIRLHEGSQADPEFLSHVANENAPDGFDIIIDDASHVGELTKVAFWHLFDNHLKPHGLYVIEDWGTGYWGDWPDGKCLNDMSNVKSFFGFNNFWQRIAKKLKIKIPMRSHSHGMVGFVKQLIDEQGAIDVTRNRLNGQLNRASKFESIVFTPSAVFVRKAGRQPKTD